MRLLLQSSLPLLLSGAVFAQYPGLTLPPSGNNQKACVTQYIGPVHVSIDYSSPAVHSPSGEDRRGKIWGKLVPYGLNRNAFGHGKPAPWRAGANENTVFTVSHDVMVNGKPLPAGRYGLHMIPGQEEWTVIFSKNSSAWGSFFYEEGEDALRVTAKPAKHDYREWLTYEFTVRRPAEAQAETQWEDLAVPITIQVADADAIYLSRLRQELTSVPGFSPEGFDAAAAYTVQAGKGLDLGLEWAEAAISRQFIGKSNFDTLNVKSQVLAKMGRAAEAKSTMEAALNLPTTTPLQIHLYGRQLLTDKKTAEAMDIFKLNARRNGDTWPVHVGLARGYAATGDNKQALEHARKALTQAPDDLNRQSLESMVKTLSEGQMLSQ